MIVIRLFTLLFVVLLSQYSFAAITLNFPFIKDGVTVETLAQLQSWLKSNYAGGDVSIYILPGTYTGSVSWSFQATSGTLKIAGKDPSNLPIFDGCLNGCIQGEASGFFMRLQDKSSALSNIILQRIKVKNYVNGVFISNASNVTVNSMVFENIGTAFNDNIPVNADGVPAWGGFSSLMTDISTGIKITQNTFKDCYNKDNPLWFHAVYLKSTVNSYVTTNVMDMISGDPIRLRHECNNVRISGNTIQNSGMAPITTFEQAGLECPSTGIKASSNFYGMMFPYKNIYSQAGYNNGWANKAYLNEGMIMGQGYKVTVDPALSPISCQYRNVANKWQVFTSNLNSFVLPTADSRIFGKSLGLTLVGTGTGAYVSMVKDSKLVVDTNMYFVGCNSDSSSTCNNNGTSDISDDTDPFNEDRASITYFISLKLKMGLVTQKIQVSGGPFTDYEISIAPPTEYDASGWAVVQLPVTLTFAQRSQAILNIKTLNSGLKIQSVILAESN
jgi:hypothetical protein